jgi:hypothetical protein
LQESPEGNHPQIGDQALTGCGKTPIIRHSCESGIPEILEETVIKED